MTYNVFGGTLNFAQSINQRAGSVNSRKEVVDFHKDSKVRHVKAHPL